MDSSCLDKSLRDSPRSRITLPSFSELLYSTTLLQPPPTTLLSDFCNSVTQQSKPSLDILAKAALNEKRVTVEILELPRTKELVAKKNIKFSVMVVGTDEPLYIMTTIVNSTTLEPVKDGVRQKVGKSFTPSMETIIQPLISYKQTDVEFK